MLFAVSHCSPSRHRDSLAHLLDRIHRMSVKYNIITIDKTIPDSIVRISSNCYSVTMNIKTVHFERLLHARPTIYRTTPIHVPHVHHQRRINRNLPPWGNKNKTPN